MGIIPGGIKIELDELAHGTITALTQALQSLADELHTYNHPTVEVHEVIRPTAEDRLDERGVL